MKKKEVFGRILFLDFDGNFGNDTFLLMVIIQRPVPKISKS
jgi:hypothetical protein